MTGTRIIVVLGDDPRARSAVIADRLLEIGGTALVLTGHPEGIDGRLDTADDGPVEVRVDDPIARLDAYRSGAVDPDDEVLAALAVGGDSPLAAVLGWEYARRAAAVGVWDVVVVELEGGLAGVRRVAAAGELSAFVESRWPAHRRFASMAAGDRAGNRVREAHRLALLAADVADFLAGPVEVVVVGDETRRTSALAALARGAAAPAVTGDGEAGYRVECPVPGPLTAAVSVEAGGLRVELAGFRAVLPLPALLSRCVLVGSHYDTDRGSMVARFVPDPALWPPNLARSGSADRSG